MFDVAKTREFYLDYLGFTVDFEHRFGANTPLFMQVSRDGIILQLSEHHGDGSPGASITIELDGGVDDLHAELTAKRYRYMRPGVESTEWGTRELGVIDPARRKDVEARNFPSEEESYHLGKDALAALIQEESLGRRKA